MLHNVDHNKKGREEPKQIPVDGLVELIGDGLVSNEHDPGEAQRHEAHPQVLDIGKNRGRGDRENKETCHHSAEPEKEPALDTIVLIKASDKLPCLLTFRFAGKTANPKQAGAEGYRHDSGDKYVGA